MQSASSLPARASVPRRLAAFVHADMVGYSRLVEQDDSGTYARLARLRHTLIDPALERYGGKLDNTAGDALLMEFSSVLSAVRFAVEIQTRMPEFDDGEPPDRRIRFRMGINAGDAISDGPDIHGDSVNIAARLQALCPPGGVCVSTVVRNQVQERLDLQFESMGALHLKNITQPVEAFAVRLDRRSSSWTVKHGWARKGAIAGLLVSLCIAAVGLGLWLNPLRMTPDLKPLAADSSIPPLSIAVLPFANLSNDPDQEYLAEGISEDLTTDLSHLEGVFIVARESAFTYLGKQVDIREVGRQLGVRYVLEGSVRKLGDIVRINAQLVSANDGAHVWADRFEQPLRDLQAGQDSTVKRIGEALNIKFDKTKQQPTNPTANPGAYDLVLRARAVLQEPRSDIRNTIAAGYFEQALRLDPTSVPAKVGVATMLIETSLWNRRDTDPDAARINRAAGLIASAEQSTPNSPDVLAAKFRLLIQQRRYEEAVATFSRLLEIDSSAAGAAGVQCARCWGRPEDAVPLIERTALLNPLAADRDAIYATLGRMLIMLGRDTEAIGWLERGLRAMADQPRTKIAEREPGDFVVENTELYLAVAYAFTGRLDDAHTMLASAMSSERTMDFTVRSFLNGIPIYFDAHRQEQERRIAEGLRRAGLRDHLDEATDYKIESTGDLREKKNEPTPTGVPGATTIRTEEMARLLETKPLPLVLTTASANPTIPGAILVNLPNSGSLTDEWQTALGRLVGEATNGDKQRPIVTFAYCINRWHSRNLALRLIALGYSKVYWYRGGWEAWDAHDLPKAPLTGQFLPAR